MGLGEARPYYRNRGPIDARVLHQSEWLCMDSHNTSQFNFTICSKAHARLYIYGNTDSSMYRSIHPFMHAYIDPYIHPYMHRSMGTGAWQQKPFAYINASIHPCIQLFRHETQHPATHPFIYATIILVSIPTPTPTLSTPMSTPYLLPIPHPHLHAHVQPIPPKTRAQPQYPRTHQTPLVALCLAPSAPK